MRQNFVIVFILTIVGSFVGSSAVFAVQPGPTCLNSYTFKPIPSGEWTENIVFAVNEDYASSHPEWHDRAEEVIAYVNKVLSQNTQKRYNIAQFLTYPLSKYQTLADDKDYHLSNGTYGGTTFFYYVYDDKAGLPQIISGTNLVNVSSYSTIHGQQFYNVWGVHYGIFNILLGKSGILQESRKTVPNPSVDYEGEVYSRMMRFPVHELGHTLGLAFGEWYLYNFNDKTGVSPKLAKYNYNNLYPRDPMVERSGNFLYKFSDFNVSIINLNANHQFNYEDIAKMISPKAVVRVKDAKGKLVPNATVKVFGATKNAIYIKDRNQSLLQSVQTGTDGTADIDNISSNFQTNDSPTVGWLAKIIKVSKGGKTGGAVFTLVDSEKDCILNKNQTHYIDIKIK